MSTGQDCALVEHQPGEWWLLLEHQDCDEDDNLSGTGEWFAAGPFRSKEETCAYLHANHANPGSWRVYHHEPARPSTLFEREITAARASNAPAQARPSRFW